MASEQYSKRIFKNGGHINPVTIDHINDIEKSFNFTEKQFVLHLIKNDKYGTFTI